MVPMLIAGPAAAAAVTGGLQLARQVFDALKTGHQMVDTAGKHLKNGSLIDIARVARVEPILVVDADCMNLDYLSDTVNSLHTLFAGYYLQAASLMGSVGGVKLVNKLAPLNPSRVYSLEERKDWRMAAESYKFRLPTTHNKPAMETEKSIVMESLEIDKEAVGTVSAKEAANLSTGKLYQVTLQEDGVKATIPIAIRVMVSVLPTKSVVNMFTFKDSSAMDLGERFHAWKAGELEFIRDLILCNDLVKKHRTALIKDKDGVYSQILGRETGNKLTGLFKNNPSLATASNLAIVSTDTVAQMELKMHGKLSNFKVRSQLFDNTNLMILAVVDKQWERVTFYHRGMQESSTVSAKEMKSASKGGGSEVMDVMKAFLAGSAPII